MPELVSVPDVDGVPAVLFAAGTGAGIILAAADAIPFPLVGAGSPWGLYFGGEQVIQADTVLAVDYKEDWVIADYPIERGGFESYNKVATPFDVRLVFAAGGTEANRTELLNSIAAIIGDLELYDVVTPEAVYENVNVIHYDYRRTTQSGLGMLVVSIFCQEVRQAASGSEAAKDPSATGRTGDTAAASGAGQTNGGTVQATDATAAQVASVQTQDFTGGYNVSGFNVNATATGDVGELVATGPNGEPLPGATVPGSAAVPSTSSTISGLPPAGHDTFTSLNVGTGGLS
jgi:hypothetical protein